MRPLVSILIPAFNVQDWITETLRSALAQTWEPKEIIVVDDGSYDETLALARRFESDVVRVITQQNQGAAAARNTAFAASRGDYIQWLDADDLLAPDKIAQQLQAVMVCRSSRTLLSSAWGRFLYRPYCAEFVPSALWGDLSPVEWLLHKMGENLYMQTGSWLVSRELTEAAGPWNTSLLGDDDGEYFCRVLLASDGVRFVPQAKAYYRQVGSGRLSHIGQSQRKMEAHWLSMQLHMKYLRSLEDSERVRACCLQYLQTSLVYFYPDNPALVEQAKAVAHELGGQLQMPRLSWKYAWIERAFGWQHAKRAQSVARSLRQSWQSTWDRLLLYIDAKASSL